MTTTDIPRIVLTRALADPSEQERLARSAMVVIPTTRSLDEELIDADGVIAVWPTRISAEMISAAPRLRIIATVTAGSDHVDVAAARARNIEVVTGIGASPGTVAEYVIWASLSLRRGFHLQAAAMAAGHTQWPTRLRDIASREVRGQVLGIAGFGHIGRAVAEAAAALGMQVLVHDPYALLSDTDTFRSVPLQDLLERSDTVSLHVPLTMATRGLIGAAELRSLGPESFLVNVSRGGVVDETALLAALSNGQIAGAAVDVFEQEPPHPKLLEDLAATGRVLLTPHIAGFSEEAASSLSRRAVDAMLHTLHN